MDYSDEKQLRSLADDGPPHRHSFDHRMHDAISIIGNVAASDTDADETATADAGAIADTRRTDVGFRTVADAGAIADTRRTAVGSRTVADSTDTVDCSFVVDYITDNNNYDGARHVSCRQQSEQHER